MRIDELQIFNFLSEDWDTAVILDACRYDTFSSMEDDLRCNGKLEKKRGASCTTHWIRSVFEGEYSDTIYVSGNPWVNSLTGWDGFDPRGKFKKIVDVWDWGWDDERGTVPPKEVTEAALQVRKNYPDERMIVHYLQPHYPYLSIKVPRDVSMYFDGVDGRGKDSDSVLSHFCESFNQNLKILMGKSRYWRMRNFFGLKPGHVEEYLWRTYSPQQLRELYEDNLRRVIEEVNRLLEELEGRFVVTSDHGEALGEDGEFFHPLGTESPAVRDIPYWVAEAT